MLAGTWKRSVMVENSDAGFDSKNNSKNPEEIHNT